MPTLQELLSSGDMSPLAFGMSRKEVADILGEAEGHSEYGHTVTEKRGQIQIRFESDMLAHLDWILGDTGESVFEIGGNVLSTTIKVDEFLDYCDKWAISWSIDPRLSFDRQLTIRTCHSVVVIFDLDHRELQRISVASA